MFSKKLKELRAKKDISQASLAKTLGMSQQAIAKWETDKATPDPDMISKIANFFGVSTDYLLGHQPIKVQSSFTDTLPQLTLDDEQDIALALEDMMNKLTKDGSISFYGKEMTEGEKEMLRISIENALRVAKQMTKDKEQNK